MSLGKKLSRRDLLDYAWKGARALVAATVTSKVVFANQTDSILHSIPPITQGTKYALFRQANTNDVLDAMDALVGEYDTQMDAFNALKESKVGTRHYLVGNGKILALTQNGAMGPLNSAISRGQPVYAHAMDINGNGKIDSRVQHYSTGSDGYRVLSEEVTKSYFFLDEQFARDTLPSGAKLMTVAPNKTLETITSR